MTLLWWTIALAAVVTFAIKAVGPALVGGRRMPSWAGRVIELLAAALLAGLIVVNLAGDRWSAFNWPAAAGLAAACIARLLRAPVFVAIALGIALTAGLRLLVG